MFGLDYWYVFPFAILVAAIANASGFSGSVLFQPFFNLVLGLPLGQSIATGIATETIGMSSGASRYFWMKQIDGAAVKTLLSAILVGVVAGLYVFSRAPTECLRLTVGLVVGATYSLPRVGVPASDPRPTWRFWLSTGGEPFLQAAFRPAPAPVLLN